MACSTNSTPKVSSNDPVGQRPNKGRDAHAPIPKRMTSTSRKGLSAEEDWKASISGGGSSAERVSEASPICVKGESLAEDTEDDHLTPFSAESSNVKGVRKALRKTSSWGSNLEVGLWSTLNDYLLEKIFARLPFKSLFRLSYISKTWNLMLRSHSFQKEIPGSIASSWKIYAAVFSRHTQDLIGYESNSRQWHRLPTHSYVQQDVVRVWTLKAAAGSLLCWICPSDPHILITKEYHVHVTNPLTRSWKQLPPRPEMQFRATDFVHVGCEGTEGYKVILGTRDAPQGSFCIRLQIFDSTDNSWTMESYIYAGANLALERCKQWGGSAFTNGVFHALVFTLERRPGYVLISFDVKDKIWKETPQLCQVIRDDQKPHHYRNFNACSMANILVCGSSVMLMAYHWNEASSMGLDSDDNSEQDTALPDTLSVFRLDLERGLAFEESRVPNEMFSLASRGNSLPWWGPRGHGDCIFIGGHLSFPPVYYNVRTQQWHSVDSVTHNPPPVSVILGNQWAWVSVTYQPGLNPFIEV